MSIAVVCRNGHSFRVKDCCAGRKGRCPVCRAVIEIPNPQAASLSDEDILDILGTHSPNGEGDAARPKRARRPTLLEQLESAPPPPKTCEKCDAEMDASSRICPKCHTYVAVWANP